MFKYLILSTSLLMISLFGLIVARKHLIIMLMSLEILLLASSINFVIFSVYYDDILGQMWCLLVLTIGGAESAIGLDIIIAFYRLKGSISIRNLNKVFK